MLCKGRPKWKQAMHSSMKAGLVIMVFWSINLMGLTNLCDVRRMFHVEWSSKCQFAVACFSHLRCPYISGCQKPWSGAACSQSVRPLHVSWQRHCGRWRHRSDEVPSAKSCMFPRCFMMFRVLTQEMEKEVEDHRIELDIVQRRRERELESPGGFLLLSYKGNILSPFLERTILCKRSHLSIMFFC